MIVRYTANQIASVDEQADAFGSISMMATDDSDVVSGNFRYLPLPASPPPILALSNLPSRANLSSNSLPVTVPVLVTACRNLILNRILYRFEFL